MNAFIETLNNWGGNFLKLTWPIFWQSSVLIIALFLLEVLLRGRLRASIRYALWLVVLVKLCLPPTFALPTGPAWWLPHAKPAVEQPAIKHYVVTYDDTAPPVDFFPETVPLPSPPPPRLNAAGWGLLGSMAASLGLLLWLALNWWRMARKIRRASLAEQLNAGLEQAGRLAGVRSPARLKLVEGRMSPAVCGLFRPVILLPRRLVERLSPAQLRAVLLHELFHLRRRDVWVNCVQALLQIVYWWHPLLWLANARIRCLREEAVDDAVMLALREEAETYAPTLLEVAKLAFRRPLMSLGLVGIMESRSALRQRIERLVDFRVPRRAGLTFISVCGVCVFSAVALPMGEAPASPKTNDSSSVAIRQAAPEQQSLSIKVDPEVFFRNLKAQAPKVMQSPTNDWGDILMALLRDEGVDCNPPHGLAFTNTTDELTTRNTPEKLEVFRRVIEQLNRADGICELPLSNNPLRKRVVIEGRIYSMSDGEFEQFTSGLHHYSGKLYGGEWWSVPPEQFNQFVKDIEASGLKLIQRPRIQTGSGMPATLYVGNVTNSFELTCQPVVDKGFIDFALASTAISGAPANAVTNEVSSKASAEDHGGIVLRMENYGDHSDSNLVIVISAEIVTNSTKFHDRLQAVIQRAPTIGESTNISISLSNGYAAGHPPRITYGLYYAKDQAETMARNGRMLYEEGRLNGAESLLKEALKENPENTTAQHYLDLVQAERKSDASQGSSGREGTERKLDQILIPHAEFKQLTLQEVVRELDQLSRENDSDKVGVHFETRTNAVSIRLADIDSVMVNIRSLTKTRLVDVLDAIVMVASKPIGYRILQDGTVVFSLRDTSSLPVLESGTFHVDPFSFGQFLTQMNTNFEYSHIDGKAVAPSPTMLAHKYFASIGVVFEPRIGKSIFYKRETGELYVKATKTDLDLIESALLKLNVLTSTQRQRTVAVVSVRNTNQPALPGRQQITQQLNSIRLDHVAFDATPLSDVLRYLSRQSRQNDPKGKGVNFLISPNPETSAVPAGFVAPVAAAGSGQADIGTYSITIDPPLTNATLGDVLDEVVRNASEPIKYSIQDFAVVFSAGIKPPQPLYSRVFMVDTNSLVNGIRRSSGLQSNNIYILFREYFGTHGVDWKSPQGKAVFYHPNDGRLFVKATAADLDLIERTISNWLPPAPQIHIKARFVEVPKGTLSAISQLRNATNVSVSGSLTGILNPRDFKIVYHTLQAQPGFECLAEPEATTTSGLQTQMRATRVVSVITNFVFKEAWTNQDGIITSNSVTPETSQVEMGPILDVVPDVLADGYTINLRLRPSFTEFLGYDTPTNNITVNTKTGEPVTVPQVLPHFRIQQTSADLKLWDGQTVVLGRLSVRDSVGGVQTVEKSNTINKTLLIFITATIVDPTGHNVHGPHVNDKAIPGYYDGGDLNGPIPF